MSASTPAYSVTPTHTPATRTRVVSASIATAPKTMLASPFIVGVFRVTSNGKTVALIQSRFVAGMPAGSLGSISETWVLYSGSTGTRTLTFTGSYATLFGNNGVVQLWPFPNRLPWTSGPSQNLNSTQIVYELISTTVPATDLIAAAKAALPSVYTGMECTTTLAPVYVSPANVPVDAVNLPNGTPRDWMERLDDVNGAAVGYVYAEAQQASPLANYSRRTHISELVKFDGNLNNPGLAFAKFQSSWTFLLSKPADRAAWYQRAASNLSTVQTVFIEGDFDGADLTPTKP